MPVTGLCFIQDTSPNFFTHVTDRLFKLHPTPDALTSRYQFTHSLFREIPAPHTTTLIPTKQMQQLEFSWQRGKMFCQIDKSIVVIDKEFEKMVKTKLNAMWGLQQAFRGEVFVWEMEEFRFKVGSLIQSGAQKGYIVEVEYLPLSFLPEGATIIREIMRPIVLEAMRASRIAPERARYYGDPKPGKDYSQPFTSLDTGRQYMELLRLRREDGKPL